MRPPHLESMLVFVTTGPKYYTSIQPIRYLHRYHSLDSGWCLSETHCRPDSLSLTVPLRSTLTTDRLRPGSIARHVAALSAAAQARKCRLEEAATPKYSSQPESARDNPDTRFCPC